VIKTRASGHDPAMREFTIDASGITINTTTAAGQPSAPSRATSADPA
jgi:hypothetical protein